MQHAIIIFLLVCQFAIFAGIFWAEVMIGPAGGAFAGDGRHGSIIPNPGRIRSARNDMRV